MDFGNTGFRPRYGYRWWVNSVPVTRKYLTDTMEHFYKRRLEEEKDEEQARYIQGVLTEQD